MLQSHFDDPLAAFSPPVRRWFAETFGPPTPPQTQGWPAIQSGAHTLILAPTGSGKTLAAFLWGIDQLYREWAGDPAALPLRLVYISPLKALNNDIQRNLRVPLAGIRRQAQAWGLDFPSLEVAVRSGDTPQRERLAQPARETPRLPFAEGRWTLVHRFGVLGKAVSAEEQAAQQARQLLARYGVVTSASLDNESGAWEWGPIYQHLQRLELRGEVRHGYFVQGLAGVQFALPEVVERLRLARSGAAELAADEAMVVLNACDPANLYGPAFEHTPQTATGEPLAFARLPSTWLVQQRGLPLLLAGDTGRNLTTTAAAGETSVLQAIAALCEHLAAFERRVTVESWNGAPVLDSPGRALLEAAGFIRDYPGMTWHRP